MLKAAGRASSCGAARRPRPLPRRRLSSAASRYRSNGRSPALEESSSYEELVASYSVRVPELFNIGVSITDRHCAAGFGDEEAIVYAREDGGEERHTFRDLSEASNRLANALRHACGVDRGDRVGIYLPQMPQTAACHAAVYKLGAVALPLFTLFGPEAVQYRLDNSGARCVVTDAGGLAVLGEVIEAGGLPALERVVVVGAAPGAPLPGGALSYEALLAEASPRFEPVPTRAEDPALIIYTSGTTGPPKGCVHAHRVLLGHLPGVEMPQNFFPQPGDVFWTPADWAWIGGLLDVLLPSLHHRVPVVAHRARKFDPDDAFDLIERYRVRNVFMPPTALKLIRKASSRRTSQLRSVGSGGETLGAEMIAWGREAFGVTINEFYGQTECNLILSNCAPAFEVKPGSMGRAVPGKRVAVVDAEGREVPDGEAGDIAVRREGDLTMFLGYWGMPEATAKKFAGGQDGRRWLLTGDQGARDPDDGYFRFRGRDDDIISTSGYRVGPSEIESCIMRHPRVGLVAVVGKPDPVRGEVVKAYVVLRDEAPRGPEAAAALVAELQEHVRGRLAAYEFPRSISFVRQDEIPLTTTGKIIRGELRKRAAREAEAEAEASRK